MNSFNLDPVNKESERNIQILLCLSNVFEVYYMTVGFHCFRRCNIRETLFFKSPVILLSIGPRFNK